jgi:hypothetical protein
MAVWLSGQASLLLTTHMVTGRYVSQTSFLDILSHMLTYCYWLIPMTHIASDHLTTGHFAIRSPLFYDLL